MEDTFWFLVVHLGILKSLCWKHCDIFTNPWNRFDPRQNCDVNKAGFKAIYSPCSAVLLLTCIGLLACGQHGYCTLLLWASCEHLWVHSYCMTLLILGIRVGQKNRCCSSWKGHILVWRHMLNNWPQGFPSGQWLRFHASTTAGGVGWGVQVCSPVAKVPHTKWCSQK